MDPQTNDKLDYIICPVCGGQGANKYGLSCLNCGGMGMGAFVHGRFLFWGVRLGRAMIDLRHSLRRLNLAINVIFFLAGVSGLAAFGYWIYLGGMGSVEALRLEFWRSRHVLLAVFYASIIADMFIFYRMSEDIRRTPRVKAVTYDEKLRAVTGPGTWEELRKLAAARRIDTSAGFDIQAYAIVEEAFLLAQKLGHAEVSPLHLFYVSAKDIEVAAIFSRLNIDSRRLSEKLYERLVPAARNPTFTRLSLDLKEALIEAYADASDTGLKKVTAKNFLIPCLSHDEYLQELLYDQEVEENKIRNVNSWFSINEQLIDSYRTFRKMARFKPGSTMDRAYTAVASPLLSRYSYDLTNAAKWNRLDFCVAREEEISRIWQNYESGRPGVLLVGPPGAGKKTVAGGIAQLMVREDVPKAFRDKRLLELDVARLVSGASPAQAEERLLRIIDEVYRAGNIILYIDNIENLMGISSGGEESLDLSEVLAGALERRVLLCLASVTNENYIKYLEDKPLGRIFATTAIDEPAGNQAIRIIESKIGRLEGKYKVYFTYTAIEGVIKLSRKFIHDKYLPAKAIDLLELVAVRTAKTKGPQSTVTDDDIAAAVSELTGIPVTKISEAEGARLLELEDIIHERMVNQEEAVAMVASSLRRARTELREGKRPIANFLFLGPTGVGKTELAKTVAAVYFGDEKYMIRLDMSEYQHPDSIVKMIGDSDTKGYLTEAVRKSPFSLILLDEIEKGHPDIMNLFLQVMDDGRLTDGAGRTVDFTSSIVIATSNAGAVYIQEEIFAGTPVETIRDTLINEHLNKILRPELINRFDGVIVFEPLSLENVVEIAHLMLKSVRKMLLEKGIELSVDPEGARVLAKQGFDPKFGARPLRRVIQNKVEDKIANRILSGELKRRDTVLIDAEGLVQVEKGRML